MGYNPCTNVRFSVMTPVPSVAVVAFAHASALPIAWAIAFIACRSGVESWRQIVGLLAGLIGGFLLALFVADAMAGKPEGGALGRMFWYALFGSIGGAVTARWKAQAKAATTSPSSSDEGGRSFYDQAILEIRERRAIQGVWAQAFAETEGDQKRTMARYISLRVAQLKAEQQAAPEQAPGNASWWRSALLLIGMFLLATLIGPAPAVLAVLAYGWMKPKFGIGAAIFGAVAVGICLTIAASMLLQQDWGNGSATTSSQPLPGDPATASPAVPQPSLASANPFTDPNYGLPSQPNKFSFEEAKGEPAPQAPAPPAPQPAAPPSENQLTQAAINETLTRFPYLDGPGSEKWVDAAVAWRDAYRAQGMPNHLAIKHGAEMVDRYRTAGHGACSPVGGRTDQAQCR